jgi:solute carrier family 25 (mitochondrial phosphate transporter), member 23/24/25/41
MWQKEGTVGFFKGNGITILKIAPFSAFEFYFYEVFKNNLFPQKEKKDFSYLDSIICGGMTGVVASTLTYPLDLVKTYLTINIENDRRISIMRQTQILLEERGILGLYKGYWLSMAGIAPFIGVKMASFDWLMNMSGIDKTDKHVKSYNLVMGALAGTIAVTCTYPIDLVRRLLQLNGSEGHHYRGFADACR